MFTRLLTLLTIAAAVGGCTRTIYVTEDGEPTDEAPDAFGDDDDRDAGGGPSAIGHWYIAGTLEDGTDVAVGWTLCSDNRMYGFSEIDGFTFLDKGTWSGAGGDQLEITWSSKDTYFGDVWGPDSATFEYDPGSDELCCMFGAPMWRLEGEVHDSDCDPGW